MDIVLIEPEIPPNTGNVGRLCLATGSVLHLVKPLGFSISDRDLKRAGLDYWKEVDVRVWDSFDELQSNQEPNARYFFLTTKSDRPYYNVNFRKKDFLVFGRETKGLPEKAHLVVLREAMATDPFEEAGIYVGTDTGQLFYSRDSGDSWDLLADFLPPIQSVEAAVV